MTTDLLGCTTTLGVGFTACAEFGSWLLLLGFVFVTVGFATRP
jgi:hypothetical protein